MRRFRRYESSFAQDFTYKDALKLTLQLQATVCVGAFCMACADSLLEWQLSVSRFAVAFAVTHILFSIFIITPKIFPMLFVSPGWTLTILATYVVITALLISGPFVINHII